MDATKHAQFRILPPVGVQLMQFATHSELRFLKTEAVTVLEWLRQIVVDFEANIASMTQEVNIEKCDQCGGKGSVTNGMGKPDVCHACHGSGRKGFIVPGQPPAPSPSNVPVPIPLPVPAAGTPAGEAALVSGQMVHTAAPVAPQQQQVHVQPVVPVQQQPAPSMPVAVAPASQPVISTDNLDKALQLCRSGDGANSPVSAEDLLEALKVVADESNRAMTNRDTIPVST
jgi:hypothetical protein